MSSPLLDKIQEAAALNPAAPAFIHGDKVFTYRRWMVVLCAMARLLRDHGIKQGDTVAVILGQSPYHCAAMVALARLGAIAVPLPLGMGAEAKTAFAERFGVNKAVVRQPKEAIPGLPHVAMQSLKLDPNDTNLDVVEYQPDADTPFRIALTSGTTGSAKGVLYTHGALMTRIDHTLHEVTRETRMMIGMLQVTLGFMFAIGLLTRGACVVFAREQKAQAWIEAVNLYAVTHILTSPTSAMQLLPGLPPTGVSFPTVRNLRLVGSKASPRQLEAIRSRITPHIFMPYGLTELGPVALATSQDLIDQPDSAGRVNDWAKIEIVDDEDNVLPPDTSGHIRIQTDTQPTGYYRDPEATAKKFRKGWFYPGDIGRLSADGRIYIEGRSDDQINVGGSKVSPGMIENNLVRHEAVAEAVVFPFTNDDGEVQVAAALILEKELGDDFAEFCRRRIGAVLSPKKVYVFDSFPRNDMDKILRAEIPKLAESMQPLILGPARKAGAAA